ncbi:MAG: transcription termination factor NusA [Candidatus Parcubacteria bacterium]|nr:transcription termination factor NusA [Candidatus Parcubacteria bacterium]
MDLQTIQTTIKQIAAEKGIAEAAIMETINSALAAAYRKDFGQKNQNIIFEFEPKSGQMKVYDKKIVVDFPDDIIKEIDENGRDKKFVKEIEGQEEALKFNPKNEILLADAKPINKKIKVGEELITELEIPADFGRMAAQTAKQVIIQKIREAERETIFNEYKGKEGQLVTGVIQRREIAGILVDMGKVTALMPYEEQVRTERYNPGERMKFYLARVEMSIKGPEIIVSRASAELIKKLFSQEIPEINGGAIEIMSIAREAGFRSKVAVKSNQENIDPIGSCVGQRGSRIQTIINELGGEKIDIIEWDEDIRKFISNALSPAKVIAIDVSEKDKTAVVTVSEDQLSLAIGREGQNVRLAAKLTGSKINIMKATPSGEKENVELEEGADKATEVSAGKEEKNTEKKEKKVKKEKKATEAKEKKVKAKKKNKEAKTEEAKIEEVKAEEVNPGE